MVTLLQDNQRSLWLLGLIMKQTSSILSLRSPCPSCHLNDRVWKLEPFGSSKSEWAEEPMHLCKGSIQTSLTFPEESNPLPLYLSAVFRGGHSAPSLKILSGFSRLFLHEAHLSGHQSPCSKYMIGEQGNSSFYRVRTDTGMQPISGVQFRAKKRYLHSAISGISLHFKLYLGDNGHRTVFITSVTTQSTASQVPVGETRLFKKRVFVSFHFWFASFLKLTETSSSKPSAETYWHSFKIWRTHRLQNLSEGKGLLIFCFGSAIPR